MGHQRAVRTATGAFYRSELHALARRIDEHLVRWAVQTLEHLRGTPSKAGGWLADVRQRAPKVFAHWQIARITNNRPMGALCPETVTHGPERAGGGTSLPPLT